MSDRRYIVLTMIFEKEGDVWTGHCKELGTASFGDTIEEAEEILRDLIALHLNTLEDVGECDRFLKEHNVPVTLSRRRKKVEIHDTLPLGTLITKDSFTIPQFYSGRL